MPFVKGQSGNPGGRVQEKLIRDALLLAAQRVQDENDPNSKRKLALAAEAVVEKAVAGDILAFKEMADRIDGKAKQQLDHTADDTLTQIMIGWLGRAKANGHAANGSANGHDEASSEGSSEPVG